MDAAAIVADLTAESAEVDGLVADLPAADWHRDTPAAGWTIAHQIAHLAWTDQAAVLAVTDPDGFAAPPRNAIDQPESFVDRGAEGFRDQGPALLARGRGGTAGGALTGAALDFCLLVPQRRHRSDLALLADGAVAEEWLDVAQAFAGPPGPGREPSGVAL